MSSTRPAQPKKNARTKLQKAASAAFVTILVFLILVGIFYRFNWVNWNQGTDLHPDEYGLTSTLTQLHMPKTLADYFNTRLSPISPYQKYNLNGTPTNSGPDNRMRWGQWPIILIRAAGEMTGNTGYGEIRLLGRRLSALADTLALLMIFLIGDRLYGRKVGLLAAALSSLAVMQIQQSHFMTVDNFGVFFTTLAMYACVRIAQAAPVARSAPGDGGVPEAYRPNWLVLGWYALFGAGFGMALACKVNLLPLGGMVLVAAFISVADLKLKSIQDLRRIFSFTILFILLGVLVGAITFRVTQPMSFRAVRGDTTIFTLHPNQDWVDSMNVASAESNGTGGGPPGEQWAHRPAILFPLTNMVLWGMGLPLGLAAWLAFGFALWQLGRHGKNWKAHLLPLVWTGGYFLFMGTRWVKSVRYFLPIYPFLCLLAAWGLLELWKWAQKIGMRRVLAAIAMGVTLIGTLVWASAFMQAVYATPHTRIQAAQWIYQNIDGPFHLTIQDAQGNTVYKPIAADDGLAIPPGGSRFVQSFVAPVTGQVTAVTLPHVQADSPASLNVAIASNPDGTQILGETQIAVPANRSTVTGVFQAVQLTSGTTYYLAAWNTDSVTVTVYRNVISNESWDEGLPMPFDNYDPFGGLYRGLTMEVRWPDDEHKKQMFLDVLSQADYILMTSQRAIWSTCRIPLTYPMTMQYYRALFDGQLGFEQVASFSAPIKLGPLWVSDVGGTFAWERPPSLPLFNHSWLAAEEAFSVYDHPPVWIFKKRADFSLDQVKAVLDSVDLSKVVVQGPLNAGGNWCPAK